MSNRQYTIYTKEGNVKLSTINENDLGRGQANRGNLNCTKLRGYIRPGRNE